MTYCLVLIALDPHAHTFARRPSTLQVTIDCVDLHACICRHGGLCLLIETLSAKGGKKGSRLGLGGMPISTFSLDSFLDMTGLPTFS